MKRILFAAIITFTLIFTAIQVMAADDMLDMNKVVENAVQNSISVRYRESNYKTAKDQYDNAMETINAMKKMPSSMLDDVGKYERNKNIKLTSQSMEYQKDAASRMRDVEINTVKYLAYTQYINLLKLKNTETILQKQSETYEQNLKKLQLLFKAGRASANDLKRAEINYKKSKLQLESATRNYDSLTIKLNKYMGASISTKYSKITDDNIIPDSKLDNVETYVKNALENRYELVNADGDLKLKTLQLNLENDKADIGYSPDKILTTDLEYEIDSAQSNMEKSKIDIELQVRQCYKAVEEIMDQSEIAQRDYELALSNYNNYKSLYDASRISLRDYESSYISVLNAEVQMKNQKLDTWLSQKKLEFISGLGANIQ